METTTFENQKTISTFIHISTFTKYLFPFGNFIAPIILWTLNRDKPFIDYNGRQAINFQLSIFLYSVVLGILCIPLLAFFAFDLIDIATEIGQNFNTFNLSEINNISGFILIVGVVALLFLGIFIIELYAVISASISASRGIEYKYPFCIPFIKPTNPIVSEENQQNHEHSS